MRSWEELRPEVVTDPARVTARREQLDAEVRAYRQAEMRQLRTVADFGDGQQRLQ